MEEKGEQIMSRWNFDKHNTRDLNGKYINANRPLDTNPDHYKTRTGVKRQRDERVADPSKSYNSKEDYSKRPYPNNSRNYTEGVMIHFIGGSAFKFKGMTAKKLTEIIQQELNRSSNTGEPPVDWLELPTGDVIKFSGITHYGPYKFYEYHNNRGER